MMVETTAGVPVTHELLHNYIKSLVNQFFKILPMRENGEDTIQTYMQSLQIEMLGCQELIGKLHDDASYLTLLSVLQYLIDNPECSVPEVKREVFKCIRILNKMEERYTEGVLPQ